MQTLDNFKQTVSNKFWKKITKNSLIPYTTPLPSRETTLETLYQKILNKTYFPSNPREYLVHNKDNGVSRLIPIFSLEDYCLYYYCVTRIEEFLVKRRVTGTYGGYRMNTVFTKKEREDFNAKYGENEYIPPSEFNKFAWKKDWGDFQDKIYHTAIKKDYSYYVKLDIANFYDSINIELLEHNVKISISRSLNDEVNLLFFFLNYWNRPFRFYSKQTSGLPQNEMSECSRLLANFYLQEYDKAMKFFCDNHKASYLRYADDQIIMSNDRETLQKAIFFASKELHKIGLNINAKKVEYFSKNKFIQYWAFDIFNLLKDSQNATNIEQGLRIYFKRDRKNFRYPSVLKRILGCDLTNIDISLKFKLLDELLDEEFLVQCDYHFLEKIYGLLPNEQYKKDFLNKLHNLNEKVLHNRFQYTLIKLKDRGIPIDFYDEIKSKIQELNVIYEYT